MKSLDQYLRAFKRKDADIRELIPVMKQTQAPYPVDEEDRFSSSGDEILITNTYEVDTISVKEEEEEKDWKAKQEEKEIETPKTETEINIDEVFKNQGEPTASQQHRMSMMERDQRTMDLAYKIEKLREDLATAED